ncbi:Hypothetical protein SRAE_2000488700 [Strongyloides ratti]|uniref:Proteasome inhibitor PI31 subunit n=1 Tax=Strongyloides ratti TaxID=34506 RepID=A0A090LQ31_STRRB|nr:Hypothetical protein SRAE_2000488700 [Strongyloides ratti]CEF70254.1 Hypothetical protein SRAE_2000488700 [Strongyloides ratti]
MLEKIKEIIVEETRAAGLVKSDNESSRLKMVFYSRIKNTHSVDKSISYTLDFIIYENDTSESGVKIFRCTSIVPSIASGNDRLFGNNISLYKGMITSEILREVTGLVKEFKSLSSTVNNPFVDIFRQALLGTIIVKYLAPKDFLNLERLNSTIRHSLNNGIARNYWIFALKRDFNVTENTADPLQAYKLHYRRLLADRAAENRANALIQEALDPLRVPPRRPVNPDPFFNAFGGPQVDPWIDVNNPFNLNPFRNPDADLYHPGIVRQPFNNGQPRGDPRNFGRPFFDGRSFDRNDII